MKGTQRRARSVAVGARRRMSSSSSAYDLAHDAQSVVTALTLESGGARIPNASCYPNYQNTFSSNREVTLQDILDLSAIYYNTRDTLNVASGSDRKIKSQLGSDFLSGGNLDFESSRVVIVNTKARAGHRRKRSLSVSPRLGNRASDTGSSSSVADHNNTSSSSSGGGGGAGGRTGGFYTWMQSSLRRRLRKRAKKSTTSTITTTGTDSSASAATCTLTHMVDNPCSTTTHQSKTHQSQGLQTIAVECHPSHPTADSSEEPDTTSTPSVLAAVVPPPPPVHHHHHHHPHLVATTGGVSGEPEVGVAAPVTSCVSLQSVGGRPASGSRSADLCSTGSNASQNSSPGNNSYSSSSGCSTSTDSSSAVSGLTTCSTTTSGVATRSSSGSNHCSSSDYVNCKIAPDSPTSSLTTKGLTSSPISTSSSCSYASLHYIQTSTPIHPTTSNSNLHSSPSACLEEPARGSVVADRGVTYVNHRNGSVTAVSASSVLQALRQTTTSASAGAKTSSSSSSGVVGQQQERQQHTEATAIAAVVRTGVVSTGRPSYTTRGRSSSAGRRALLGVNGTGSSGNNGKKGGKKKRNRVLGGAWGLFHCAGAGARSRSCTPERHANFRVNRSRSATPERYINVRVNQPPINVNTKSKKKNKKSGSGGGGLRNIMKGRSLTGKGRRAKSSRRSRFSAESDEYDDDANKENKYDMWGFIKERLDWSGSGRSPKKYASERLSRRDTLPCRPRGSVNINRDEGTDLDPFCPPSPPDLPAVTRSMSEQGRQPLPPKDMCTYIQRVPPTTDVNFNHYGMTSVSLRRGETLPLNLQKYHVSSVGGVGGQMSVASSMTSVASRDSGGSGHSKDSGVSTTSGLTSRTSERSHSTHRTGTVSLASGGTWDGISRDRTNTLPSRYRNRPLPPIPKPELPPPKPQESGIHLVRTLKLDKFMKNKWISGVAVTKKGDLMVVDLKEAYLVDPEGNLKRIVGTSGKGALKEPIDVTVLPNGNVAFSDHADQEVKVFTTKGQFVRRIMDKCLANIAGVAASTTGEKTLYVAGTDKRCITVHSYESADGYLYSIPAKDGSGPAGSAVSPSTGSKELFEHPYSIAINPLTGDIIVGDDYKQRVVALSAVDGRVLWRYSPTGDRHFFPCSIAVDAEGYIFIADLCNEKVYMLDSSGKHLKVLLSRGEGLKGGPGAIAVDGRGHLVVADEERTLKVFKYGDKGFALYRRFSMCPDAK